MLIYVLVPNEHSLWRSKTSFETFLTEVYRCFIDLKNYSEKKLGKQTKTIRTDNGTEYTSHKFENYLRNHGIQHELTVPYTPQQNGIAERMNRTIIEAARCMPKSFWAEAVTTAAYIRNRCSTRALKDER